MAIFQITADDIRAVPQTTFAEQALKERDDLQRLLRRSIEHISPDTMILAEEFGSWDTGARRIDLLGLDREGGLVVIELKRSDDGGHMELQALRYAAMISSMTFAQAVVAHRAFLDKIGEKDVDAQTHILDFLGASAEDGVTLGSKVRIVLAAADFSKEITTTVLWLNASGLDVRCVRMRPHSYGNGDVLLDIQQVIPLPEAAEYQVAIQQKAALAQAVTERQAKDFTKYDLVVAGTVYKRLSKRDFAFYVMQEAIKRGAKPDAIHKAMHWKTNSLLIGFDGLLDADGYVKALIAVEKDPKRYFCQADEIFQVDGRTYALTNQWNTSAEPAVKALIALMGQPVSVTYSKAVDE